MSEPVRPEDLLPGDQSYAEVNGVTVRKGTVGAFLANVQALQGLSPGAPERSAIESELRSGTKVLRSLGLFDVFGFRDAGLAETLGVEP